jgi:dTDP-4-dehydrorhamnose 3,5-epimerase-like enzyme
MADQLAVRETVIPGFYEIDLVLHGDQRGWFKENYLSESEDGSHGLASL